MTSPSTLWLVSYLMTGPPSFWLIILPYDWSPYLMTGPSTLWLVPLPFDWSYIPYDWFPYLITGPYIMTDPLPCEWSSFLKNGLIYLMTSLPTLWLPATLWLVPLPYDWSTTVWVVHVTGPLTLQWVTLPYDWPSYFMMDHPTLWLASLLYDWSPTLWLLPYLINGLPYLTAGPPLTDHFNHPTAGLSCGTTKMEYFKICMLSRLCYPVGLCCTVDSLTQQSGHTLYCECDHQVARNRECWTALETNMFS